MFIMFHILIIADALEVLRTMRNQSIIFNKDTHVLAAGACYKLVRVYNSLCL